MNLNSEKKLASSNWKYKQQLTITRLPIRTVCLSHQQVICDDGNVSGSSEKNALEFRLSSTLW